MPNDKLIQLNVGGKLYTTTRQTLLREENSLLSQIASETGSEILQLPDGTYFIDRNGKLFSLVLDFLRSGKLLLPENFYDFKRLTEEAIFYRLEGLKQELASYSQRMSNEQTISNETANMPSSSAGKSGGFLTLGYRSTFAFGRDGQTDVKFRKLYRILICGKASLCREVFGDTLNESRDPTDREGQERYTSRLYLKHQCLEKACDTLAEKGFKLIATCCNGANGLSPALLSALPSAVATSTTITPTQSETNTLLKIFMKQDNDHKIRPPIFTSIDLMNQRNSGDYEEQRWAHYTEFIFYRDVTPNGEPYGSIFA